MSHVLLKRCTSCKEYTLQETCPRCGAAAKPNKPAKFSPEDNYGEYRRRLKKLDKAKGPGNSASERVAGAQPAAPAVPSGKAPLSTSARPADPPTNADQRRDAASARSAGSADGAGRRKGA